jgi:kynureninase
MSKSPQTALSFAQELDTDDSLASFRNRFHHNVNEIYLDGNSLGKQPKQVKEVLSQVVENQWAQQLISSWNAHWLALPKRIASKLSTLLNVSQEEVIVGESTSVNLYKVVLALAQSEKYPKRLITDSLNFPTDNYVLEGISTTLSIEKPVMVRYSTDLEADIDALKETMRQHPGIFCLSLVSYKSAYLYPIEELNTFAKANNSVIVWDLSHAVGTVNLDLKKSNTLVAVGCTYKYLNGGPGAPAFLYVDDSLIHELNAPIQGWFGHARPFEFSSDYSPSATLEKFSAGTPQILSLAAMEPGIDLCLEAGIGTIRTKSVFMGEYLLTLIQDQLLKVGYTIESPLNTEERGSHITLSHPESWRICQCLDQPSHGRPRIVVDFRPDRFIRLGMAPLYTRYIDLWQTVQRLKEIVSEKEYLIHDGKRPTVT